MVYSNYDIHQEVPVRFTVISMEKNWANLQISMLVRLFKDASINGITAL